MRATFLTLSVSRNAGGIYFCLNSLAKSLMECDVDTDILAPRDEHTRADLNTWPPIGITTLKPFGPKSFGYSSGFDSHLAQHSPDIMHVHGLWMYHSWACQRFSRAKGIPYLVSPHGMLDPWALRQGHWKKRIAGAVFGQRVLHHASCLHALNESEVQSMRAFGCKNPICVIPNGISLSTGQGSLSVEEMPWKKQAHGRKAMLYVGRIHPKKGLLPLLDAWAKLDQSLRSNWLLQIVGWGQGAHEGELQEVAQVLGIADSVLFLGPRFGDQKDRLLRDADAFVHTSFSEGLPMAILEAWAYRLPVVMTPECNLPIGFERSAALSVSTEIDSIRRGLSELMQMSDVERERMGQAGRTLVEQEFSWPKVAQSMRSVYQWLLGGDQPDCVRKL